MYLLRLDDASPYMNDANWIRMEQLLDAYSVKPIVGIIPDNRNQKLRGFGEASMFWERAERWQEKGWTLALHGYNHVYETKDGGLNPVNQRSEFAGVSLELQKEKIKKGYQILLQHGLRPEIFYAPAHTFDRNTLLALKEETDIRIISDTVANDVYYEDDFFFIPQQSGKARKLPFKTTTFCYHPNIMTDADFTALKSFLNSYGNHFGSFSDLTLKKRKRGAYDKVLRFCFQIRKGKGNTQKKAAN